jgi:hypothetical protein
VDWPVTGKHALSALRINGDLVETALTIHDRNSKVV